MAPDPCRAASSPGLRHQMAAEDRDEHALGVREELALPKGLARGQTGLDGRAQTSLPVPVLPPGTFLDLGLLPVEAAPPPPSCEQRAPSRPPARPQTGKTCKCQVKGAPTWRRHDPGIPFTPKRGEHLFPDPRHRHFQEPQHAGALRCSNCPNRLCY